MGILLETARLEGTGIDARLLADLERAAGEASPSLRQVGFCTDLDEERHLPGQTRAERVVVLGIGGSALGTRCVHEALASRDARPILVVDNVDPSMLERVWASGDPQRTAWVVISKSGTTTETLAQWAIVRQRLQRHGWRPEVHIVTGPTGALREVAMADRLPIHEVPEAVGGRFSVFTPAGTVPLALAGHDVRGLIRGARAARDHCVGPGNVAARIAALLSAAFLKGRNVVALWAYAERLEPVGEWFRQLWAESLGKRRPDGTRVGQTPIHCVGSTDQHSVQQLMVEGPPDRAAIILSGPGDLEIIAPNEPGAGSAAGHGLGAILEAMRRATASEMVRAGTPLLTLRIEEWSEGPIASLLMVFLCATVLAGRLLGVDPFGQPGVEAAKLATKELLRRPGGEADREIARLLGEGTGIRCP